MMLPMRIIHDFSLFRSVIEIAEEKTWVLKVPVMRGTAQKKTRMLTKSIELRIIKPDARTNAYEAAASNSPENKSSQLRTSLSPNTKLSAESNEEEDFQIVGVCGEFKKYISFLIPLTKLCGVMIFYFYYYLICIF